MYKLLNKYYIQNTQTKKHINLKQAATILTGQEQLINELYEFRLLYNAHLFNIWHSTGACEVYKSRKHHDGKPCTEDKEWFIVVANTRFGQISNHYHNNYWTWFMIPEKPQVTEYDDHTLADVRIRLAMMLNQDYAKREILQEITK